MMKILLKTALSPYSGYGNDGIQMAQVLSRATSGLALLPNNVQSPLPPDVAEILTREVRAPYDLILVHQDPLTIEATEEMRRSTDLLVGWTMWEWSTFDAMKGRSTLRRRLKKFDLMVAYDPVTAEALRPHYAGPIIVQQGGYDPLLWPPVERDWYSDDFYFGQIGVLSARKAPFVNIRAFAQARAQDPQFARHARLMLKTNVPGLHSRIEDAYPNVRIFYDNWSTAQVREFYQALHVMCCPSRGEGKNLPALEFLSTGGPVIATDWGGHTQWLDPAFSWPLRYRLEADNPKAPQALSASASIEHMAELMLEAFHDRTKTREMGQRAALAVPARHSWSVVMERLLRTLSEHVGGFRAHIDLEALHG